MADIRAAVTVTPADIADRPATAAGRVRPRVTAEAGMLRAVVGMLPAAAAVDMRAVAVEGTLEAAAIAEV